MFDELIAQERERWHTRTKILGWSSAVWGLLGIAAMLYVAVAYSNQIDLAVLVTGALILPVPLAIGGAALALDHRWSRYVLWPTFVLMLPAFPIGTAFAAWGMWVLYNTRKQPQDAHPQLMRDSLGSAHTS